MLRIESLTTVRTPASLYMKTLSSEEPNQSLNLNPERKTCLGKDKGVGRCKIIYWAYLNIG